MIMALDTNKCMANIVAKIEAQPTVEKQVEFLQLHSSYALKAVLGYGMDPNVKWLLPDGDPPYRPLFEAADQEGRFYVECKKLIYFVDSPEGAQVKQLKREQLFIQVLESIDPRDAKMLLRMKNHQIKIRPEAIAEAFPNMWEAWGRKVATPIVQPAPIVQEVELDNPTFLEYDETQVPVKRGRGRPKGSTKKEVA
jgi:hypothetical protein